MTTSSGIWWILVAIVTPSILLESAEKFSNKKCKCSKNISNENGCLSIQ
jgi:hypothetical protein